MKNAHLRNRSKANADLVDELDLTGRINSSEARQSPSWQVSGEARNGQASSIVPKIDASGLQQSHPHHRDPKPAAQFESIKITEQSQRPCAKGTEKTRFEEIMSYLGDVEEEFSQMVSNRTLI